MKMDDSGTTTHNDKSNGHILSTIENVSNGEVWKTDSSKTLIESPPVNPVKKVRLPVGQRAGYSIGHVYNDLCASMWFTYLLMYYTLVLGFTNSQAGLLVLIGQVADAVATPFVGLASDKNHSMAICKYGRRKIWHLIGEFHLFFKKCNCLEILVKISYFHCDFDSTLRPYI